MDMTKMLQPHPWVWAYGQVTHKRSLWLSAAIQPRLKPLAIGYRYTRAKTQTLLVIGLVCHGDQMDALMTERPSSHVPGFKA